jgi:hypothetical protein
VYSDDRVTGCRSNRHGSPAKSGCDMVAPLWYFFTAAPEQHRSTLKWTPLSWRSKHAGSSVSSTVQETPQMPLLQLWPTQTRMGTQAHPPKSSSRHRLVCSLTPILLHLRYSPECADSLENGNTLSWENKVTSYNIHVLDESNNNYDTTIHYCLSSLV